MITLTLKDHTYQWVVAVIEVAVPNAANRHATTWWTTLRTEYGTISPTQVFDLIKTSLNFCLDGSKHPHPQLDVLENIYADMTSNGVDRPDFFKFMILLSHLPPSWETSIIQTAMVGGTILGVTWALTKETILCYWDAKQAKKVGHRSPAAHKLSAVKKYQGPPSFRSQAVPPAGGSSQGKKKKCGSTGKGQKKKFGAVHFATATSPAAPVAHTIASLMPRGLAQRLEVSEPPSSSFGQGPWTSFNTAMISTDHLQVPKTQRNIQRLEKGLLEMSASFPSLASIAEVLPRIQPPV